jgi:hypothetical protein
MTNNIKKGLALMAGLALLAGCSGDKKAKLEKKENPICEFKVSEYDSLYNFGPILGYAGMPNKETFSLFKGSQSAVNLYYPSNATNIYYEGRKLEILDVNPQRIKLRVIGE